MCSIASICGADGRLNVDSVCTVHCVSGDAWNVDEFLRFLTDASPATIKAYRQDLNDFIRWSEEGGYRTPKAISRSEINGWIAGMHNSGRAQKTMARRISALRRYYKWLLKNKLVAQDLRGFLDRYSDRKLISYWMKRHRRMLSTFAIA